MINSKKVRIGTCTKDCYGSCVFKGIWDDEALEYKLLSAYPLKEHPFTNGFFCPKYKKREIPIVDQGYSHKGVNIGEDVYIGAGAIILEGTHVGEGSVIGAGSVVTKDVPPYTVVVGVPARIIGKRT